MANKKLLMKSMSAILAATVAITSSNWMPVTAFAAEETETTAASPEENNQRAAAGGLVDFKSSAGDDKTTKDEANKTVTLENTGSDHFAIYNGLENTTNDFVLEADVNLDNGISAALVFGIGDKNNPGGKWYGANINTDKGEGDDKERFRIFQANGASGLETKSMSLTDAGYTSGTLHLKIDVKADGTYTYSFGGKDGTVNSLTGQINGWQGGYVGILTFNTKATFSNISFENRQKDASNNTIDPGTNYKTNLESITAMDNATWKVTDEGLYSDAAGKGGSFLFSQTEGTDFVYSTDVIFKENTGAAALLFRGNNKSGDGKEWYAVNLDASTKKCKFWKWQTDGEYQLIPTVSCDKEISAKPGNDNKYTLKVVAIDSWISYYVNDELIASTGDHTLQEFDQDRGQGSCFYKGFLGLLNWNGKMVFQNTYYKEINDSFTPLLNDVTVSSSNAGDIETKSQFFQTEPTWIQFVKNSAETVNITAAPKDSNANITIKNADGTEYNDGKNIPLNEGANYITIESSVQENVNGIDETAKVSYRINVHRRQPDIIYYNEPHRSQYHYSVKDGWGNDPNSLVYCNSKWHFFYQFYDDIAWEPMHQAHSTSTDLIHWKEEPVALYPDANGTMFNSCTVIDKENTSGLFTDNIDAEKRWVAFITDNGNGQRIKLATSTDEGMTWTKEKNIAIDWKNDPLNSPDFRDPKVFRWENKWFMVIAGGPLRIYSSENLKEWQCESTYPDLHTECPDLYPVKADDGIIKWVLSRGGRHYKIGDFKEVNGKWSFVPDDAYAGLAGTEHDGIMNFGKDSYAAMTWYIQDFGTKASPELPDILEINWANTWDYCRIVAKEAGQKFNATYNLVLKLGVKKENGKYVLTQTPIQEYDKLRDTANATELKDVTVSPDNTLLKNFKGDCYEIVSHFMPEAGTKKLGFKVRTGANEETVIIYDLETETLSIDRSKSGIIINGAFEGIDSQKVTKNENGSVDLHIYVDRSLVEVFTKDYTAAGANQIFPSISSLGASVFTEGGNAKADITIYPMNSIWTDKAEVTENTKPVSLESSSKAENQINVGESITLNASLLPVGVKQDITWSADNNSIVSINTNAADMTSAEIKALKAGTVKVSAVSAAEPLLKKEFTITVLENNFDTNLAPFIKSGSWIINDKTLSVSNNASNDYYMTKNKYSGEYTLETNIKYTKGLVNIFFAGKEANPFTGNAYALQFGDSSNIKLFRFAGDDIKTENMGKNINDGNYHNIKITKTTNSVVVYVDGTEYLSHTFDTVEDFYNNAHAGIGLWDGALEVQGFKKAPDEGPSDPANTPGNPTNAPISPVKNSSKKPIKNITVNNTKYKVTSVKNTQTVQVTGIKKNAKNIVIPPAVKIKGKNYKVTSIAKNTFKGNKKLTEITIGKNISSIGKNAFKGCNNLKNIKIKTTKLKLKNVGNNAFKGINSKAKIKAPKSKVKLYKKIVKAKGAGKNVKVSKLK